MNEQETLDYIKGYTEDLLTFFDINTDVKVHLEDDVIEVVVPSTEINSLLIGRGAETLRSIQFLLSSALRAQNGCATRVNLDIADYKKQRAEKTAEKAREWIEEVRKTGSSHIESLNAADRRIVHQVAKEYSDIETFSEGEGRDRKIIIAQVSS